MPVGRVRCLLLWEQLLVLPSRVEYLSPQEVLRPRVYGTIASPLWLEMRGSAAWQATPSCAVCRHACHRLLPWSLMQPGRAPTSGLEVLLLQLARRVRWVAPVRPGLGVGFVAPCPSAALGACACAVS